MFSAVIFHDAARKRGIKPILGCEVYVAPGRPPRQERARRARRPTTSCCWPRTHEGFHNLIKLVSAGLHRGLLLQAAHRQGRCWPQHATGLIGLSSCLKGEVAERASAPSSAKRAVAGGRDLPRHPRRRQLLPRDAVPGHRRAAHRQQRPAADRARPRTCRSSCTNDVHYLRQDDRKPHDILLCIGTGKTVNDAKRLRYHGDQFFLKTPREMAAGVRRLSRGDGATRCASPSAATSRSRRAELHLPNFEVPGGLHARRLLRARGRAQGFAERLPRLQAARGRRARCATRIDEYEQRLDVRDRR